MHNKQNNLNIKIYESVNNKINNEIIINDLKTKNEKLYNLNEIYKNDYANLNNELTILKKEYENKQLEYKNLNADYLVSIQNFDKQNKTMGIRQFSKNNRNIKLNKRDNVNNKYNLIPVNKLD